ncbi:hypothetical protein ANTRET_LOCUS2505 [Anthophora retusa]
MELSNGQQVNDTSVLCKEFLEISCNWQITNNKQYYDAFTVAPSSQESEKTNYEDIVSLNTCISLQPTESTNEPCMLDIKLTNDQKISRIALVSEAYILEFFKQFGEYETTIYAEFIDEFEDNTVHFAETAIIPHTTEASIKFTKTRHKNSVMWIYGIRLYLTEPSNEPKNFSTEIFNPEIIQNFLSRLSFKNPLKSSKPRSVQENDEKETEQSTSDSNVSNNIDIVSYIDNKFQNMEAKLMKKIDEMEQRTNEKLDTILKQLQS